MKHFISYTILILSSFFIFSGHLFNYKSVNKVSQIIIGENKKIKKDSTINKLPEGYPYITNFTAFKQKHIKSICSDNYGIMVFADNSGISFFDGETEQNIEIPESPNMIKKDMTENTFYLSCKKGFGIVSKNKNGNYSYRSLSDIKHDNNSYENVIADKDKVFFSGKHKIVSYDIKTEEIKELFIDRNRFITGIFLFNNKLFANFQGTGLANFIDSSFVDVISDSLFSENEIIFNVPYKNQVILGLSNNKIYIFDGTSYSPFETDSKEYIQESIINGGGNFNDDLFVVTTLNGGAVILEKETGKTKNTLNYITGLPDDEIFAFATDKTGGLWVAHEYGTSRVAFDIPVKNFSSFPGLQGNINAVKFFDSTLYVATGEGLFKLSEIKSYEEVKVAESKRVKYTKKIKSQDKKDFTSERSDKISSDIYEDNNNEDITEKEDRSFFKRWKKRKDKKKKQKENIIEENNGETTPDNKTINKQSKKDAASVTTEENPEYLYKTEYKTVTEYKKIYELHSAKFIYKKIEGINSKSKALTEYADGLLISTNSGLFFIGKTSPSPVPVIPDTYVYDISCIQNTNTFYVSSSQGVYKVSYYNNQFIAEKLGGNLLKNTTVKSIFTVNDSVFWAAGTQKVYKLKTFGSSVISTEVFKLNSGVDENIIISKKKDKYIFLTNSKAFYFNDKTGTLTEDTELTKYLNDANKVYILTDSSFTLNLGSNVLYKCNVSDTLHHLKYAWVFDNIKKITVDKTNDIWIISGNNEIFQIKPTDTANNNKFKIFITSIKDFNGNTFENNSGFLELNSNYKNITVRLSSPGYLKKGFVKYFYGIDVADENEFLETEKPFFTVPELTPGKHVLSIYAINALNEKSETLKISVEVKPPMWQTTWFLISIFILFLVLISLGISAFYRTKQRKIKEYYEILELKVKERTAEIEKQNQLIQNQNQEIYIQYQKIEIQNKEITDSIRYAGRIQKAALSDTGIYKKYLSEFFILFKPRDIVSGDFYWISESKNKLVVAAADCTGHGVPGGFLSMLGISFLNEIVKDINKTTTEINAADILTSLRKKIITTLTSHGEEERKDGMDISVVIIDKQNMKINFAGANNPAYIIRSNNLTKIDADRMPVGYNKKLNDVPFKNKYVSIKPNDIIYLFSDGYADQFGGKNQKKFNSRRFREMLLHIHKLSLNEQKIIAEKILNKWKGENLQIDDILLIGMKI